ncbi:MAG: pitrilysin family protein [Candidatus Berkelbacteria bacterium]|nr:pitrilysin family protein [Candidatus Berkelbacteria bacterium]
MFKKKILKNGLRLVEVPMQGVDTATSLVIFGVGSRHENKKNNGISHLIEHLAFKGTKKRPKAFSIAKDFDSIGADYNAFTSEEYTGYFIKSRSAHLEKGLELLSDMVLNSLMREKNIAEEQKVIVEEIRMKHDTPIRYADMIIENLLYQGNPLGYPIAGTEVSVKGIKRGDILSFCGEYYHSRNSVLVVAGKLPKDVDNLALKYFPFSGRINEPKKPEPFIEKSKAKILIDQRKTKQSHLRLASFGLNLDDKDQYIYEVLGAILGGSMSSRLFREIREKRSLAYYINADAGSYTDTGGFIVRAGVNTARLEESIKVIMDELYKTTKAINDEEVSRAKEILKGAMALEKEDSYELAWLFGHQELLQKETLNYEQIIKKIDSTDISDIKRVAKKIFGNEFYLALVGQGKEEKLLKLIGGQ